MAYTEGKRAIKQREFGSACYRRRTLEMGDGGWEGEGERDVRIIVSAPVVVRVRVAILRKACECSHFYTVKRGCFLLKFNQIHILSESPPFVGVGGPPRGSLRLTTGV